jgi:hypothetical protein
MTGRTNAVKHPVEIHRAQAAAILESWGMPTTTPPRPPTSSHGPISTESKSTASLIPLFTLGIPGSATTALVFVERPIALALFILTIATLLIPVVLKVLDKRKIPADEAKV